MIRPKVIIIGGIFLLGQLILLNSCTEDIDLFTTGEKIPIVYALLDPDHDTQFIRVGESFQYWGEKNALNEPQLTHLQEDFEVYISHRDENGINQITRFEPYTGAIRDSGLFHSDELQLLSAELSIELNKQYKLYLYLKESEKVVYGELKSFARKFNVIDPLPVAFRTINLFTNEDFYFRFDPVAERAVYQSGLSLNYTEYLNGERQEKSIEFPLDISYGDETDKVFVETRFSGEYFLREIGRRLKAVDGISRMPTSFNFWMSAGGEEMFYLIRSAKNQLDFSVQSVSNLDNGIGIFSTLSHRSISNLPLSRYTADSLAMSPYTSHLGFIPYSKPDQ